MCEINVKNFKEKLPIIKKQLETAKFIGLDLEFSALNTLNENLGPSLFDNPETRYVKLRKNLEFTIPIQIGLTAFQFNADKNLYVGNTYTFYVKPGLFSHINKCFHFESSSLEFLAFHNFDFNKFVYLGIPYISKNHENDLRKKLANREIYETNTHSRFELKSAVESKTEIVKAWHNKANNGESLEFPELSERFKNNLEFKYFFLKHFQDTFQNLWTFEKDNIITFQKVSELELAKLKKQYDLDEQLVENLLGFSEIYKLLTSLKKPIVGHNVFSDLLILINNFEGSLPVSYNDFKKLTTKLFPIVYDTKHISYNLNESIPKAKQWNNSDLKSLFEYFKNGSGRHLAMHSPQIEIQTDQDDYFDKYHEAGWDSFCAGYIFIRMAYLKIYKEFPKAKVFMPVELLNGMVEFKNCINVIRGSTHHINLDGDDPETTRPPWLVVESIKNKKLNLKELCSTLSAYGNVEVKPIPWRNKALVAVENYGSAKSMMRGLDGNSTFRIRQYNFIKHSPIFHMVVWGSVTFSGLALIWLLHSGIKR